MTGIASIVQADARALPLPDASVDLVVTSPPYFALRSYTDGGEQYAGQIGVETTPQEYIDNLITCTRELMRVLKPTGSIWVNLGDKYSGAGPQSAPGRLSSVGNTHHWRQVGRSGIPSKSLMGVPWRYALRCVDELRLILRAEVIWSKPNGLPESVTDRVRRAHEQWFHFTVEPHYYSAVDEIREQHTRRWGGSPNGGHTYATMKPAGAKDANLPQAMQHPLGRLPGSVWEIATEPLHVPAELGVDHFAAFPTEWPRRIILGWSPSGICVECGEGRRPISESRITGDRGGRQFNPASGNIGVLGKERVYAITGEVCACDEQTAETRPAVVLDPFGGTGTTALVAKALGRHGVSVDRSADYCRLAQWRTTDPGELAKAMRVEKPRVELDGQSSLFDALTEVS